MTNEQKAMMNDAPERTKASKVFTKKRVAVATGVVAVGVAAYFIGPKIVKKVQLKRALTTALDAV
ncbi:hypothetical protein VPHD148_0257 [Vibrio phage D148]